MSRRGLNGASHGEPGQGSADPDGADRGSAHRGGGDQASAGLGSAAQGYAGQGSGERGSAYRGSGDQRSGDQDWDAQGWEDRVKPGGTVPGLDDDSYDGDPEPEQAAHAAYVDEVWAGGRAPGSAPAPDDFDDWAQPRASYYSADEPEPRRRLAIPLIAGGIVVAAIAGFIGVHVVQNAGKPGGFLGGPVASSSSHASAGSSPSAVTSATPNIPDTTPSTSHKAKKKTAAGTVPAALAGTWAGQVKQAHPADTFGVRVKLTSGSASGGVVYSSPTFSCTGDLTLASDHDHTLVLDQHIVKGSCGPGTVTLVPAAAGTVQFTFKATTGLVATGVLSKS
jgi:hypothetical protein